MIRLTLAALALALASLTWPAPQPTGSAEALIADIRAAMRAGRADRDIAGMIDQAKLTDQLEDAVIEQLQSEGAGLETLEGLDRQRERSRNLSRPSPPLKLFAAPAPPSAEERSRVLEKAREVALGYTAGLPNFLCTETVRRYAQEKTSMAWKLRDTLTLAVGFSQKGEQYKLMAINDRPTSKTLNNVGGAKSNGEFGSVLRWIFEAKSATQFQWERWTNLRGRPVHVFSYRIDQAHSKYGMKFSSFLKHYSMTSGMRGAVYVDPESQQVLRLIYEADGIPANWPVLRTPSVLDYGYAEVGGQRYLLPRSVDLRIIGKDQQSRNVTDFGNYRKFGSETKVTFEK
jgi:hypothetical protein